MGGNYTVTLQRHDCAHDNLGRGVKLVFTFLFLITSLLAQAQVYEEWIARYDDTGFEESPVAIGVDGSGNVYVTGVTDKTPEADNQIDAYLTVKYDAAGNEIWRVGKGGVALAVDAAGNWHTTLQWHDIGADGFRTGKYDTHSNELWSEFLHYEWEEHPTDLHIDATGSVYVTGHIDDGSAYFTHLTLKYDLNGNLLWKADGAELWFEQGLVGTVRRLGVDGTGNVYIAGDLHRDDYFVDKLSHDGSHLWSRSYGYREFNDKLAALAVDDAGTVYVTGQSGQIDPETVPPDVATVTYDADGNELWVRLFDHQGLADVGVDAAVDAYGNVYVVGSSQDSVTGLDYATIKYRADGTEIWVRRYDHAALDDIPADLVLDNAGNIYVTGVSRDAATGNDYATVKYDPEGNQLWVSRYDYGDEDAALLIVVDEVANVYVTGESVYAEREDFFFTKDIATIKYVQGIAPPPEEDNGEEDSDDDEVRSGGGGGGSLDLLTLTLFLALWMLYHKPAAVACLPSRLASKNARSSPKIYRNCKVL